MLHETLQQVDGQGEDDGGVLLGGDGVQRLQVTQLKSGRRLRDDVSGFLQGARGFLFPLGRDYLGDRDIDRYIDRDHRGDRDIDRYIDRDHLGDRDIDRCIDRDHLGDRAIDRCIDRDHLGDRYRQVYRPRSPG